ncbi:MAG: hypothetical protein WCH31_03430 [Actinomycetes bacterium]
MRNPVVQMRASCLAIAVLVLTLSSSPGGLATTGYRLQDAAWTRPPSGSAFSVNAHGVAVHPAHLYVYLDQQPCQLTRTSEATRVNGTTFKAGQSSFRDTRRALVTLWISGRFNRSFTANAGNTAQREYACAYLTTPNAHGQYRVTAARASSAYTVTG